MDYYWITPPGLLGTVTEGQSVLLPNLSVNNPPGPATFTILNGSLPPGITLSSTGIFSGVVQNITNPSMLYTFTIRANNGIYNIDRQFKLNAISLPSSPTWIFSNFPPAIITPIFHYPLATLSLGTNFYFTLGIVDSDGDNVILTIEPIPGLVTEFNGVLPPGIILNQDLLRLEGIATPTTSGVGDYYFQIAVNVPNNTISPMPDPIPCSITIQNTTASDIEPPVIVKWVTPQGLLGYLIESTPCYFTVLANVSGNNTVNYSLAPNSPPLPFGLTINAATGDIEGLTAFIDQTTTYTFIIRASSGLTFADRFFSMTVVDQYSLQDILNFNLAITGKNRQNIFNYYNNIISTNYIYRPDDSNYGIIQNLSIYLISGLTPATPQQLYNVLSSGYHTDTTLLLGEHKTAVARDSSNNIVYEVLYREIFDPQENAGGFVINSTTPEPSAVINPNKNTKGIINVYPNSLNNRRLDLIEQLGFDSNNIEGLPLWMSSQQVVNDNNSVIGFIPSLVLAYLIPGSGNIIINNMIANNQQNQFEGLPLSFDRYTVNNIELINTEFDATFDGPPTTPSFTTFDMKMSILGTTYKFLPGDVKN